MTRHQSDFVLSATARDLDPGWASWFPTASIERGRRYLEEGRVTRLTEGDKGWTATVLGDDAYKVFVPNADSKREARCTCPHFTTRDIPCKHLAATFLAIEEVIGGDIGEAGAPGVPSVPDVPGVPGEAGGEGRPAVGKPTQGTPASENPVQISEEEEAGALIRGLDEKELREFLTTLSNEDTRIRRLVVDQFGATNVGRAKANLKGAIDALWYQYGRCSYVEYRQVSNFEHAMCGAFHDAVDPLMRRGALEEAFEVSYAFMVRLQDIVADESDDFTGSLMSECTRLWDEILALTGQSPDGATLRATVCDKLCAFAGKGPGRHNGGTYEAICYSVTPFLKKTFAGDAENAPALLSLADRMLHIDAASEAYDGDEVCDVYPEDEYDGADDDGYATLAFGQDEWVTFRLDVMKAQGEPLGSRFAFARPFLRYREIRDAFVEEAESTGDLDRAIELLEEGRPLLSQAFEREAFTERLVGLYEATGRLEHARAELRTLVTSGRTDYHGDDARWFKKLKSLTPESEWPVLRDELLATTVNAYRRRSCLAAEGLYDELMTSIEGEGSAGSPDRVGSAWSGDRFSEVRRFRKELGGRFPKRVVAIYREGLGYYLDKRGANRGVYREIAQFLTELKGAGCGKDASMIARRIRAEYPQRTALMDELAKAGW